MRSYQITFFPHASDEFLALDRSIAQRILDKLKWLSDNLDFLSPEPLGGDLKGLYKLRVGSYRVFYSIDHEKREIAIHLVGHRRDIYKES